MWWTCVEDMCGGHVWRICVVDMCGVYVWRICVEHVFGALTPRGSFLMTKELERFYIA